MEQVILVDEQDNAIGAMEKMEAHRNGSLHRAFSVFVFNGSNEMLLQKRAVGKYHSGGLWTNSCCSHPKPGEATAEAAARRLREEMGFTVPLQPVFSFVYRADFENGLTEHEYDHVLAGFYNGPVDPDPQEVGGYAWWTMTQVENRLQQSPDCFTAWFRIAFPKIRGWWEQNTALV
ncbi:isopentenyl-diphosphate Delta-isomerase [Sediminibacterium soli]|uniref:isopentenyl-diphosphate Delta-isomerase n=1 Tax=Sediminibacterium soli TaxID=2698829 RepID=UPI0013794D36|nr:isopentenyl-diphosphate Delta-isomerase [Sediminibacterium soli]NCI45397.1 isopentenyl-diphosphate Delta-isomerase [Sediminibacterium soli]